MDYLRRISLRGVAMIQCDGHLEAALEELAVEKNESNEHKQEPSDADADANADRNRMRLALDLKPL